jgi:hypothetical protein
LQGARWVRIGYWAVLCELKRDSSEVDEGMSSSEGEEGGCRLPSSTLAAGDSLETSFDLSTLPAPIATPPSPLTPSSSPFPLLLISLDQHTADFASPSVATHSRNPARHPIEHSECTTVSYHPPTFFSLSSRHLPRNFFPPSRPLNLEFRDGSTETAFRGSNEALQSERAEPPMPGNVALASLSHPSYFNAVLLLPPIALDAQVTSSTNSLIATIYRSDGSLFSSHLRRTQAAKGGGAA